MPISISMFIRMNTELEKKIEVTSLLYNFALSIRRQKNRPELAGEAAAREAQFKKELDELLKQKAATEQPALLEVVQ